MLNITLNDIGHRLAGIYEVITGDEIICALSRTGRKFKSEEVDILASDTDVDMVSVLFDKNGKFELMGFRGEWYGLVTVPKKRDLDIVFSLENLKREDIIEEVGNTSGNGHLAVMSMMA